MHLPRGFCRGGLVLALAILVLACGGGGEDDESEPACYPPGTLQAVAVEGRTAPDTGDERFLAFPLNTPMAAADGGWLAFVARVTGSTGEVLYGVQPDGTRVRAMAGGDAAPDASAGTISGFLAVRVSPQGWILALVTITGGGPTFGLVTVKIAGGAVTETNGVVYDDQPLDGLSGTLSHFVDETLCVSPGGTAFFQGTTNAGDDGFWYVASDGTNQTMLIGTGSSLGGGVHQVERLHATALTSDFTKYAVVAEANDAGNTKGIFAGDVPGGTVSPIAAEGETIVAGDEILAIPGDQSLVVYPAGSAASVMFEASTDVADHNIMLGSSSVSLGTSIVVREGGDAPLLQNGTLGTYGEVGLVHNARSCTAPIFWAWLDGATAPVTFGLFALQAGASGPVPAFLDGLPAPPDQTGAFTSTFLGIRTDGRVDVSESGSPAYSNSLTDGKVGVFWSVRGCGLFSIARTGDPTPVGDTFSGAATWGQTTANDVLFFLAPSTASGTGLYRRGP